MSPWSHRKRLNCGRRGHQVIEHSSSHAALSAVGPLTCSVTSSTAWGCLRNLGPPRKSRSWAVRPGSQGSERRVMLGKGSVLGTRKSPEVGPHVPGDWRYPRVEGISGEREGPGRREEWRTEATGEQLGRGPPRTKILTWTRRQQGKGSRGVWLPEQALSQVWGPILWKCDHNNNISSECTPRTGTVASTCLINTIFTRSLLSWYNDHHHFTDEEMEAQ